MKLFLSEFLKKLKCNAFINLLYFFTSVIGVAITSITIFESISDLLTTLIASIICVAALSASADFHSFDKKAFESKCSHYTRYSNPIDYRKQYKLSLIFYIVNCLLYLLLASLVIIFSGIPLLKQIFIFCSIPFFVNTIYRCLKKYKIIKEADNKFKQLDKVWNEFVDDLNNIIKKYTSNIPIRDIINSTNDIEGLVENVFTDIHNIDSVRQFKEFNMLFKLAAFDAISNIISDRQEIIVEDYNNKLSEKFFLALNQVNDIWKCITKD